MEKSAKDHLKAFVERIERLEEEKGAIASDIKNVFQEAKANGFDVKALRAIIRLRKQDASERNEHQLILETYMNALGMLSDTPLGEAAMQRAVERARGDKKVQASIRKLGTPAELTEEEKARGDTAAFIRKDGTRMTIGSRLGEPA